MDGAVDLARAQRICGIQTREEPAVAADLALGVTQAPPSAQSLKQHRAEHGVTVLAALALLDSQRHALAVDVADLEGDDLADAQARAVGNRHRRLVLEVRGGGDQARRLLAAQHHWQGARHLNVLHLGQQLRATESDVEEQTQAGDRGVDGHRAGPGINQVKLEASQFLDGGRVRRAPEEGCQLAHGADV